MTLKLGSLCTGYGGLDMAVEQHFNDETVWYSEFDKHATKVCEVRIPGRPNLGDLTQVDWSQVEPIDILTAGYPCQPFSLAGARKGTDDPRHIWPRIADAIRILRPRICVFENVAAHLTLGFDHVLSDLASLGLDVRWGVVSAREAGAPHNRKRLWIVAVQHTGHHARGSEQKLESETTAGISSGSSVESADSEGITGCVTDGNDEADWNTESEFGNWLGENLTIEAQGARSESERLDRSSTDTDDSTGKPQVRGVREEHCSTTTHTNSATVREYPGESFVSETGTNPSDGVGHSDRERSVVEWGPYRPAIEQWEQLTRPVPAPTETHNEKQRLSPRFVELLMGLPDGWVTDVDIPRTQQLKALGNGVVPQQAALALQLLARPDGLVAARERSTK